MKRFGFGHGLAAAAIVLSLAVAGRAQDEGVKQVELLAKKAGATVEAIANTKVQLMKTVDVYNGLMADDATDRKGLYKKLQSEMATTEKRRSEIAVRADEMKAEADTLFKSWADSAAAISDADLRKRSDERLAKTKASFAEIGTVGEKAKELVKRIDDTITTANTAIGALRPQ
jgi:hypothetical protein